MDEQKTKYCDMENGCLFCDKLFCEGKKKEQSNDSQDGQTKGNIMTHETTQAEKMEFLNKIHELTLSNILRKEDIEEIQKILLKACNRTLSDIH